MSTIRDIFEPSAAGRARSRAMQQRRWRRTLLAATAALSLGAQDAAWATCSDGSTLPADGFIIGRDAPVRIAANWLSLSNPTFEGVRRASATRA